MDLGDQPPAADALAGLVQQLAEACAIDTRPRIAWQARTLQWVAGTGTSSPRVPPRDFVFAALRLSLDDNDPWAAPALAAYTRAARATPGLCEAMATFRVASEVPSCRR